jgi:hypothetical protein
LHELQHYIDEHELTGENIALQQMCENSRDNHGLDHGSSDTHPVEFIIRKRKSDEVDEVEQM